MNARNWVPLGDTVNNANVIQSTSSMKEEIISVQSVQQKQNFSTLEKTIEELLEQNTVVAIVVKETIDFLKERRKRMLEEALRRKNNATILEKYYRR